ncbi:MAG: DUF393 domain-containing protein [Saprospiraceae bacterium]|nr:DUF393 domain-containing protein [Saprospiraceae bacterium]
MQTLENKVIIYDDVCPLCQAYTGAFIKMGWLHSRSGFAESSPTLLAQIDLDRARHEIPLHDTQTGETLYGLDALFLILGTKLPWCRPLFRQAWFRAAVRQLYQLITYNRRIIAGSRPPQEGFDCAPDANLFYQRLYVGVAGALTALVLWNNRADWTPALLVLALVNAALLLYGCWKAARPLVFAGHWATVGLLQVVLWAISPIAAAGVPLAAALGLWCWGKRWDLATQREV